MNAPSTLTALATVGDTQAALVKKNDSGFAFVSNKESLSRPLVLLCALLHTERPSADCNQRRDPECQHTKGMESFPQSYAKAQWERPLARDAERCRFVFFLWPFCICVFSNPSPLLLRARSQWHVRGDFTLRGSYEKFSDGTLWRSSREMTAICLIEIACLTFSWL